VCGEAGEQCGEFVSGEAPVERLGDLVPVVLEGVEGVGELAEVGEVVRLEQLALDDRVVDLDLVEPAGVDWQVDEDQVAPAGLEPRDRFCAAVGGAVVDDPEDTAGGGARAPSSAPPQSPAQAGFSFALLTTKFGMCPGYVPNRGLTLAPSPTAPFAL
jgi:hypothetical protein